MAKSEIILKILQVLDFPEKIASDRFLSLSQKFNFYKFRIYKWKELKSTDIMS